MKRLFTHLLAAVTASAATWMLVHQRHHPSTPASEAGRKVLYYQSPMHPWVKSDQPGRCTVCGMELVPVYEGESGHSAGESDVIILPQGSPTAANIQTALVQRSSLRRTLRVAGVIDDDDSRHRILSAYLPGRIEKLFVNFEGAEVTEGQPLATFYSRELLAAASEYKMLSGQPGGAVEAVSLKLRQLGLTPEQISRIPARRNDDLFFDLLSPMSGTVVKRSVYPGQYVEEGAPLFELADFSTMWFQFIAYEQDLALLKIGQEVSVTTPTLPGKIIPAAVKFINPNLDSMTRSARVRVEIPNAERELRHRVYAEAEVKLDAPEVLSVPRSAVLWSGAQPRAYVERAAGTYQLRTLKLGRVGDEAWEVVEGLAANQKVVVSGNMLIDSQAQLNNVTAAATPAAQEAVVASGADPALQKVAEYLRSAARLSAALANDDLQAYNQTVAGLPPPPDSLAATVAPAPAADLKSARRNFLPWSQAVAEMAAGFRARIQGLRVLQCPMTADLWEGAPPKARWVQFSSEIQNPYWGLEMLDCGADVK